MLEAMMYYEQQAEGLGLDFLDRVDEARAAIEDNPELYPCFKGRFRRCLVKQFPYALLYAIAPDELTVTAVMHMKRHPSYWISRISDEPI
jgi:hypothetical protein